MTDPKDKNKCGCGGTITIEQNQYEYIFESGGNLKFWVATCDSCPLVFDGGGGLFGKEAVKDKVVFVNMLKKAVRCGGGIRND